MTDRNLHQTPKLSSVDINQIELQPIDENAEVPEKDNSMRPMLNEDPKAEVKEEHKRPNL